jgi:hypothetical protein
MLRKFEAEVKAWLAMPYDQNGTAFNWVLFIGFSVVVTFLWSRVLRKLVD